MLQSFVDQLSAFALSLPGQEQEVLSAPLRWVLLANGDADFHDNVILFGFAGQQNEPVLVTKVPRLSENGWMLQAEYDRLVELWDCIGAEAAQYVPRPCGMTALQDRPVLVISYLPGESLAQLSQRSFWGNSDRVAALAQEAAQTLRGLNRLTRRPIQSDQSLDSRFLEKANKFRALFQLSRPEDQALLDLIQTVENSAQSATHQVLIQGDFWHGNMIRNKEHGRLRLVDWQFARWSADVSLDVYFFLLAGALSATEGSSGKQRAREAFRLLERWRIKVVPEYLSAYGKPEGYGLLPPKQGLLLCCVEKAVRPALEFGYSHPDDAIWRELFAELLSWPDEE